MLVRLVPSVLQGHLVLKDQQGLSAIQVSPGAPVHPDLRVLVVLQEMRVQSGIPERKVLQVMPDHPATRAESVHQVLLAIQVLQDLKDLRDLLEFREQLEGLELLGPWGQWVPRDLMALQEQQELLVHQGLRDNSGRVDLRDLWAMPVLQGRLVIQVVQGLRDLPDLLVRPVLLDHRDLQELREPMDQSEQPDFREMPDSRDNPGTKDPPVPRDQTEETEIWERQGQWDSQVLRVLQELTDSLEWRVPVDRQAVLDLGDRPERLGPRALREPLDNRALMEIPDQLDPLASSGPSDSREY